MEVMAGNQNEALQSPWSEIAEAIRGFLCDPGETSMARLVARGPAALYRVNQVYFGRRRDRDYVDFREPPDLDLADREQLDLWAQMRFELARSYPQTYLREIEAKRIRLGRWSDPTDELVTLGHLDDPRAAALLRRYVRHRNWLARLHAVRGLAWRDDPESVAAVETALDDEPIVRVEAVAGVARRDVERARALYRALLDHPRLTPLLRQEVTTRIQQLG